MSIKQETIDDLIEGESQLLKSAPEIYGEYFSVALECGDLLSRFLISVQPNRYIFAAFLSQVRKNYFLALFSALRLHHVQSGMAQRQLLESAAWAAYAIAFPDPNNFTKLKDKILLAVDPGARNKWLDENFEVASSVIKKQKGMINESTAHANIIYAFNNFRLDTEVGRFETPFFDFEDKYQVKTDLWSISNSILGVLDLFYGVNLVHKVLVFKESFADDLLGLQKRNTKLKEELLKGRPPGDPRPSRGII